MPFLIPLAAAAVGAGAAIYSSNNQSKAINSAASTQQQADQAAIGEQQREFDTNQTNLAPWLNAGRTALNQQSILLGLGGLPNGGASPVGTTGSPAAPIPTVGSINTAQLFQDRPDVLKEAQRVTANGQFSSPEDYAQWWAQNYGVSSGYQAPTWTQDQINAQFPGAAPGGTGPGATGGATDQQQAAINQLQASPLYQSLYRNGVNTIDANASATGGLRGGNVQRSLANFGADTLSTVIENQLQHLAGISGQGANTGGVLGTLGAGTSSNISNLLVQQGGAGAGGILGSAAVGNAGLNNALAQLLSGAGQSYAQYRAGQGGAPNGNPGVVPI